MLRRFYRWLLRFHPTRFRERFAEEMLSIFDQAEGRAAAAELVADAFISLVRQWTMRSEYWEEKAAVTVPASAGGLPAFYTLESFKPRKSALIGGAILTWIACSSVIVALNHSRIHSVYLPSVSFESTPSSAAEAPATTPNLTPTLARTRLRTLSGTIEPRTHSSEVDRPSIGNRTSSEPISSARVSESQGRSRLEDRTNSSKLVRPKLAERVSSEANSLAVTSEPHEQARLITSEDLHQTTVGTPPQSPSQTFVPSYMSHETLSSYVGLYSTDRTDDMTVHITATDGQLIIEIPGEQKSKLVRIDESKFAFSGKQYNWVEFMRGENGVVSRLRIYRNGSDFRALRRAH
jgi:hypothetical protein